MIAYLYMALVLILMTYTHVVVKLGISKLPVMGWTLHSTVHFCASVIANPLVISGVIATVLAAGFWLLALQRLELAKAYPLMALLFLIIPVVSKIFLNEPLTTGKIIGGFFILVGVLVTPLF